jgi:hypothetical protein
MVMRTRLLTLTLAFAMAFLAVASVQVCVMPEAVAAVPFIADCHGAPGQPEAPAAHASGDKHDCADHGDACMVDMQTPSLQPVQPSAVEFVSIPLAEIVLALRGDFYRSSLHAANRSQESASLAFTPPASSITILRI